MQGRRLEEKFEEATTDMNIKKLMYVSVDGSNINWKISDKITEEKSANEQYHGLIDVMQSPCGTWGI